MLRASFIFLVTALLASLAAGAIATVVFHALSPETDLVKVFAMNAGACLGVYLFIALVGGNLIEDAVIIVFMTLVIVALIFFNRDKESSSSLPWIMLGALAFSASTGLVARHLARHWVLLSKR